MSLTDNEIKRLAHELRWQAESAVPLRQLLPEAYALVRIASRRAHDQVHYPEQLMAGIALASNQIVEMQTGEGKTLASLLPAFLYALAGRGVHVVTANDYLAGRDANFAKAVFSRLNVTVGCVQAGLDRSQRQAEYACDVTYGTAREFGFDFLRDQLDAQARLGSGVNSQKTRDRCVQRGHYFALVDEADVVMIDDARTPLLIAASSDSDRRIELLCRWAAKQIDNLQNRIDFNLDFRKRRATLTRTGCRAVLGMSKPASLASVDIERLYRQFENALVAQHLLRRNRDYIVAEGRVAIVDESTGRISDGRKWQDGLHQAVEANESLDITETTQTAARITVQNYFRRYRHLAGLTGTTQNSQREFRNVYQLGVTAIPTRRPSLRKACRPRIFASLSDKNVALVDEILKRLSQGQAVLVGTPTVRASQQLSELLDQRRIAHEVLNCTRHDQEARIIREAGRRGRVTIATNMAGRGTDIIPDESVLQVGGMHVIATEMHSSARTDRQLIGRTARQGAPGSYQFFLSLEDELLAESSRQVALDPVRARANANGELPTRLIRLFQQTQRRMERMHARQRGVLLKLEKQRMHTYRDIGLDPFLEAIDE